MTIINDKCEIWDEPKKTHLDPNKLLIQPDRLNPRDAKENKEFEELQKFLKENPLSIQSVCDSQNCDNK